MQSGIAANAAEEIAIEALVRDHARFVFSVAFSILRNHHDAEDATQEAFLRVTRHRRQISVVDNQRAWLARTVWRIAQDRRRRAPLLDGSDPAPLLEQLRSPEANAEQLAMDAQMLKLTERMVAKLPAELRDALTLSTVQELTSPEIALILGIPEASVRTRLFRARKLLKEKLAALLKGDAL
jgi:RNA polymerase sigma-70 factor (ECF subfamily)